MSNHFSLRTTNYEPRTSPGFTLVETLVAISFLTIAIVAPISLTTQSLSSAYYARDQITAFHLAQEALESVRHVRDGNVLKNALGTPTNLLAGIPATNGDAFTVNTLDDGMALCPGNACPPLKSNGELYGYDPSWTTTTKFIRSARATFVTNPGGANDEVHIEVTVSWRTEGIATRTFTISENLYRWVNDNSAVQ